MKRKLRWLISLVLALLLAAGVVFLCVRRPNTVFRVKAKLYTLTHRVRLERVDEAEYEWLPGAGDAAWDESLLLVSAEHPLPEDYEATVAEYRDSGVLMHPALHEAYAALSAAVTERYGEKLYIRSAYRSRDKQLEVMAEEGDKAAGADASEHRTGLALDVYVPYYAGAAFTKVPAGQYVNLECWEYGFIIRYPWGKSGVTGIPYEPWHLRYVGAPHAKAIALSGTTLEEYLSSLEPGAVYTLDGAIFSLETRDTLRRPAGAWETSFSPVWGDFVMMTALPRS